MDEGNVVDGVAPTEAPGRVDGGDQRNGEDSLVRLRGGGDSGHTEGSRSPISSLARFEVYVNDTVYSRVDQGADYIATRNTYRDGLSSSESSEDEELPGVGGAASAGGRGIGMEHATLPQSHRHRLLTALPPYTNIEDFSHLSKYVRTHFSGDWAAYTAFDTGRTPNGWSSPMNQFTLKPGYH